MLKYVAEYPYKSDESLAVTEYNRYALSCEVVAKGIQPKVMVVENFPNRAKYVK